MASGDFVGENDVNIRSSMRDKIAERLREMILTQKLPPGSRISEYELSKLFKVSKTPVREAINIVKGEGLIAGESWQGIYVFKPTRKDVDDIFSIRYILEIEAVNQVMDHLTEVHRKKFEEFIEVFQKVTSSFEKDAYVKLDTEFHTYIVKATGNDWLYKIIGKLSQVTTMIRALTLKSTDIEFAKNHIIICEAILAKDKQAAQELMRQHIQSAWNDTLKIIS